MHETLYSWTFNFHKVVRQQNSGAVEDFILPYSAVYLRIEKWKNYWNRSTFANVIVKIKVARFLWPTVYMHGREISADSATQAGRTSERCGARLGRNSKVNRNDESSLNNHPHRKCTGVDGRLPSTSGQAALTRRSGTGLVDSSLRFNCERMVVSMHRQYDCQSSSADDKPEIQRWLLVIGTMLLLTARPWSPTIYPSCHWVAAFLFLSVWATLRQFVFTC